MKNSKVTQARLRELFEYSPDTGVFTRKVGVKGYAAGSVAGTDNGHGYIRIRVDGVFYLAHRLAWLYVTGGWPNGEIDHRDRDRSNNRFENLRDVDRSTNLINTSCRASNVSGEKNVNWDKVRRKWTVQLRRRGRQINGGRFDDLTQAISRRDQLLMEN